MMRGNLVPVLVFVFALQAALSAQQYTVREIKTFGGNASTPGGINNHLHVAGTASEANSSQVDTFLWSLKGLVDIGLPSEGDAVNIADQVVGCADFPSGQAHAYLWTATSGTQDLGTLGGIYSCAFAVNALGEVVGQSYTASGAKHAFLWTQSGGMQDLDPNGGSSTASGINDKGQVVGGYDPHNTNASLAFIWSQARGIRQLPSPPGNPSVTARAIDNLGHIIGNAAGMSTANVAVLWPHLGQQGVQLLPQLAGSPSGGAFSVNLLEMVTGFGLIASTGALHATLWTPANGTQDLNDMIPANSGWVVVKGIGINDLGVIVAQGTHASDINIHALLLQPVKH